MLLNFRQGLVQHQIPTFYNITFPVVDLIVDDTNLVISFAAGTKEYLHTEQESVRAAWGPIAPSKDQWLYWDLDTRTGKRTFGITLHQPIISPIRPTSVTTDQHWFDQTTNTMQVWSGHGWIKRIRTFAFKLANGRVPVSLSMDAPLFTGSQVGDRTQTYAGHILYDDTTTNAIRDTAGNFITTEDHLTTNSISLSEVKLAGLVVEGEAQQTLAPYTIVYFTEFGKIEHANAFTASSTAQFGIIETSALIGQTVTVVTHGLISCPSWDWSAAGVNALLYCDEAGVITTETMIPNQIPIGTVLDRRTIQLGSPVVHNNINGQVTPLATEELYGISKLSVPAVDAFNPIVVGDNDPRFASYVSITGATMTGNLYLAHSPTSNMEAATKQYVDNNGYLRNLQDVSISNLSSSQVLWYDGTTWVNRGVDLSLGGLSDVALTNVQTNQFLAYDGSDWINKTVTLELGALSDVAISNVQTNDVLIHNGTRWINAKTYVTANDNGNISIAPSPSTAFPVITGSNSIALGSKALLSAAGAMDTIAIGSSAGELLDPALTGTVIIGSNDGSTITTNNNVLICDGTGSPKMHVDDKDRVYIMGSMLMAIHDMGESNLIDPLNGAIQYKTITQPVTLTLANDIPLGFAAAITLEVINGGSNVTWSNSVRWEMGMAPPLTASGTDIISLYTRDGGTTWRGFFSSKDSK